MATRKTGRPTDFTQELADRICDRIAEGKSLRSICKGKGFPAASTVWKWLSERDEFSEQYARAREAQADFYAEQIVEIADEEEVVVGDATVTFDSTAVARNRLRVDARKWYASKLAPKKYGETHRTELSGPDGGPIEHKATIDASGLTDDQLRALASIPVQSG